MHGAACFTGTRVAVRTLFDHLAGGRPIEQFLAEFPTVKRKHEIDWDSIDIEWRPTEPEFSYASQWDARDHYDYQVRIVPPSTPQAGGQGGPTPEPDSITAGPIDYEVNQPRPTRTTVDPLAFLDNGPLRAGFRPTATPEQGIFMAFLASHRAPAPNRLRRAARRRAAAHLRTRRFARARRCAG
ncbi:MAG: hypothetical protein DCC67_07720 [Planctomycetota bacterium]|nr:MAG: hypothetical protein DCC67_07720 [Planctomycetota bacterium]